MPVNGRLAYVAILPLHAVAAPSTGAATRITGEKARPLEGLLVMAIDDQEQTRDALEAMLGASGARVQLASSGAEAIAWLRHAEANQWPQVLLCDIVLAGENGYEVLRSIRALESERAKAAHATVPAIALTGYAETEDGARAKQAGFGAHLTKPVSPARLLAEIRRLTGRQADT
jgi:ATP-binding cassette subfamily B protein